MTYPQHLLKLIAVLKNLPGIGNKSAERFAFHMLELPQEKLKEMGRLIFELKENLKCCAECGALKGVEACPFCDLTKRQGESLCVVASSKDIFQLEETREYKGLYHVLKGSASYMQREGSEALISFEKLKSRLALLPVKEVILAFDSTLAGDAAALFLRKELASFPLTLSRIAFGIPMGSSFDFLDGGTLAKALQGRSYYK